MTPELYILTEKAMAAGVEAGDFWLLAHRYTCDPYCDFSGKNEVSINFTWINLNEDPSEEYPPSDLHSFQMIFDRHQWAAFRAMVDSVFAEGRQ